MFTKIKVNKEKNLNAELVKLAFFFFFFNDLDVKEKGVQH